MCPSSQKTRSETTSSSNKQKTNELSPHFDKNGLLTVVVSDFSTKQVLMVAWMNEEALRLSIETGFAHFWSRSRSTLWKKGETSGNCLLIKEMLIDCDQDTLWLKVLVQGDGVACHTGEHTCFYRKISLSKQHLRSKSPLLLQTE